MTVRHMFAAAVELAFALGIGYGVALALLVVDNHRRSARRARRAFDAELYSSLAHWTTEYEREREGRA